MIVAVSENRRKAVEWLRTTELPQGFLSLYDSANDCYCALGHMGLAVGIDAKVVDASEDDDDAYTQIQHAFNLHYEIENDVMTMNDERRKSLREIGDYLAEKWHIA